MHADSSKFLWDAQQAVLKIVRFTGGKSCDQYLADDLLRSGVERQFEIVGEALKHFSRLDPELSLSIPDLPRIVAFRNVLVHGYATVDDQVVWGVVEANIATLSRDLAKLLG
jgi:uncharacterized protein with HEPN domain